MKGLLKSRKFRQGSIATAITAVVVALVVILNVIATTLTDRYSLTLDLTPGKVFSITDETRQYLSGLDQDVTIYVMDKEETFSARNEYYLQAVEVLKKYALQSSRVSLEFVDLVANPAFSQSFPTHQLTSSSILITSGDRVRDVTPYDLYDIESTMYGQYPAASRAEQVLTSAILAVTSDSTVSVAVLSGHNEEDISGLTSLLGSNNYLTETVSVVTDEIDPVYDVAVIAAPQRDYTEEELRRLDTFLQNGGQYGKTLLFFAPSEQTELPGLSTFLADWGFTFEQGMVFETDSSRYVPMDPYMAVVDYAEDVYAADTLAAQQIPLTGYARPLVQTFESKGSIAATTLLQFSGTAGVAYSAEEVREPDGATIPHMGMGQLLRYDGGEARTSQVVVCGSSAFINPTFLENPNFANSDYLLGLISDLTGREEPIRIQSKSLGGAILDITMFQAIVIGVLLSAVFPLAVLIFGIVIWARRRHR